MKHKWLITLGITVVILLVIAGLFLAYGVYCFHALFGANHIKKGFSPELLKELQSHYGITIPEEAKFIEGYDTGGTDSSVLILFEYPINPSHELVDNDAITDFVKQLLKLDPARYPGLGSNDSFVYTGTGLYDEWGPMDFELRDKSISYTYLAYRIKDDKLLIRFDGWRPHRDFP